jgi:UDP-glucose 4-epimerase
MRVLVTGGGGFIGQAVRRHLEANGDEFVSFDHPNDIRSFPAVTNAIAGADGVINLAGILGTEETLSQESKLIDVNIGGALVVASACQRAGVPLVQIGTGHRGQLNVYAITKACAEDLLLARAKWSGASINVVRAFHAYGPGQKAPPPYGEATVRKIIPAFVCAALRGDTIKVNGTGLQLIDLVHVDDVARVLVDALDGPYGHTFDAGTGKGVTVMQAARDVVKACESTSKIELVPMRRGEPLVSEVVAKWPHRKFRPWPTLDDTIEYYRTVVG